jgi:hypothetical protein
MEGASLLEKMQSSEMAEETKQLLKSMEKYMRKIVKKELNAFDEYISEKLKKYPDHLVDYDEVELLRKKFYDRIKSRMLTILEDAFHNNDKEIQQFFIEKLYPEVRKFF